MAKTSKFAVGAILGAAAGLVAGKLIEPKSGKETRQDLKNKAGDMKEKAGDVAKDVEAKTKQFAAKADAKLKEFKSEVEK